MKLDSLVEATLLRREKRFLSYHRLKNGEEICAHCPNPGSMRGNAETGSRSKLLDYGPHYTDQGRKLRYRWQLVEAGKSWVCIDTSLANGLVGKSLAEGKIAELRDYSWQAEQVFADARFDFAADLGRGKRFFLEVKSVSMAEKNLALFPDSITKRGQKHLKTLMQSLQKGHKAALLFLVKRSDCTQVAAARAIDPVYADLLKEARQAGVQIYARVLQVQQHSLAIGNAIEVLDV